MNVVVKIAPVRGAFSNKELIVCNQLGQFLFRGTVPQVEFWFGLDLSGEWCSGDSFAIDPAEIPYEMEVFCYGQ